MPVNPTIAAVLARYPLPNDPQGPFGLRTYATSSKVMTFANQFSIRIDHKISDQAQLFTRFSFNNVDGPLTNPNQTAIDPSFAIRFYDRQRNFGLTYTRNSSSRLTWELSGGFLRSTPQFQTTNPIQPALNFADGLYESFNSAAGQFLGAFGNLFQGRFSVAYVRGSHNLKMGAEARLNRDTTLTAFGPNGLYTFGGGAVYSPVEMRSMSGSNDLHIGDPLPDTLTAFLTATPFSFTATVAPPIFAQGNRLGSSAVHREAYNLYFQDTWRMSPRFSLSYGLRYEVNSRFREAKKLTSTVLLDEPATGSDQAGSFPRFLVNPQPPYVMDWKGWGPRLALEWGVAKNTLFRVGGALTTLLPNAYQDNFIVASIPYVFRPFIAASSKSPVPFQNGVSGFKFPSILTPQGDLIYASGRSTDVGANTEVDLARFQRELAGLTPGGTITAFSLYGMSPDFRNGYIGSYTAGLEQELADVRVSASYTATVGVKLHSFLFPNSYAGADPGFAPFTEFDSTGNLLSGLGPIYMMGSRGHSTFHSLQVGAQKTSLRGGLGFQANYTFSRSMDNASSAWGSSARFAGTQKESFPQNPWNWRAEKGPSTFDVNHAVVFSLAMALPLEHLPIFRVLGRGFTSGWQFMNISTLTSGLPFSVYSGVQQTGYGSASADRPDQVGRPVFSTGRQVREDYFGRGAANTEFFSIPVGISSGTGPNRGRPGTLGRNTFRGSRFQNLDVALIKDTPIARRGAADILRLQFRAECFNAFNLVNFGLPANILRGTGFGLISRTAGSSRQLQFSLKLIY
ncbi:MAG: TonB-dependent receptor [Acidobacteria bacterium]|nr:TonB-dependent receptor [Acidobacteriota bacterium]MCI0721223.1 TonB-dependent receptor [Acidobacteriota bacterium]